MVFNEEAMTQQELQNEYFYESCYKFIDENEVFSEVVSNSTLDGYAIDESPSAESFSQELIEFVNDDRDFDHPLSKEQETKLLNIGKEVYDMGFEENYNDILECVITKSVEYEPY